MESPKKMIVPTVHLNGTSRERLIEPLAETASKIQEALDALRECCPNARDYYPQGPAAFEEAVQQWRGYDRKLREVKDELETLSFAIHDQGRR